MRTKALAISGILVVAMAATVATGQLTMPWAVPLSVDQDKNVTMDFTNAPAQQVLDWLKKSGVNFVVETTTIPKDKRLTVHVKSQPMDKAVAAVADALGLGMTKKGDIYTLRNGGSLWTSEAMPEGQWARMKELPGLEGKEKEELLQELGKIHNFEWKEGQELSPQQKEELEKRMELFGEKMGEFGEKFGKGWRDGQEMSPEERAKFEKEMQLFGEKMGKFGDQFGKGWRDDKKMSPEERAKFEKEMQLFGEKMGKFGEDLGKELGKMPKDGWHFKELPGGDWQLKEMPEMDAKMKELLQKHLKDMPDMNFKFKEMPGFDGEKLKEEIQKSMKDIPDMKNFKFEKGEFADIGKLVDSLTPAQLEKARSKGYLTPGDLTPEQKKMFGKIGDGEFTVTFEKGGKSVTFKNK
ncbi:MAG: hypothetical protein JSS66_16900 [Armatimonadetes bacterium]|nr:hypothetical protein [Armatimonadota bacterium]